jgi:hypothetical protein
MFYLTLLVITVSFANFKIAKVLFLQSVLHQRYHLKVAANLPKAIIFKSILNRIQIVTFYDKVIKPQS